MTSKGGFSMPEPNQNDNKNQPGGPKKKNAITVASLLLWIIALTFLLYNFTSSRQQANAVKLEYGIPPDGRRRQDLPGGHDLRQVSHLSQTGRRGKSGHPGHLGGYPSL